jgi:geranylgeranyl diphosphate synthase type II
VTTAASLSGVVAVWRSRIDEGLDRVLPRPPACPPIVSEAMRYSLFAGGKRLRPILTLASAEAVADALERPDGPTREEAIRARISLAIPSACALELIHTYSLIHDDLPAMDNDTLRRGRPTAHVVFGEGIAILAGDGLLTEAFRLLSEEPSGGPDIDSRKLRALAVVARAAGAEGMVGGQALDLQAAGPDDRSGDAALARERLRAMHARKTGALIRAAAVAGAVMAGATEDQEVAIDRFAAELGLAFQIVDDILDVEGAPGEIGKTAGKDAAAGKVTYPSLYGLAESRSLADTCIRRAESVLRDAKLAGRLPDLAQWVVRRTS